jgi:hypothetical protein
MRLIDADSLKAKIMGEPPETHYPSWYAAMVDEEPDAQPERLTDDDFETIRIHLNAFKEKLCNQERWEEAREYERIIDRFTIFASEQSDSYIVGLKTLDALIQAAYKAGREGKPLMVALNEEVTT